MGCALLHGVCQVLHLHAWHAWAGAPCCIHGCLHWQHHRQLLILWELGRHAAVALACLAQPSVRCSASRMVYTRTLYCYHEAIRPVYWIVASVRAVARGCCLRCSVKCGPAVWTVAPRKSNPLPIARNRHETSLTSFKRWPRLRQLADAACRP